MDDLFVKYQRALLWFCNTGIGKKYINIGGQPKGLPVIAIRADSVDFLDKNTVRMFVYPMGSKGSQFVQKFGAVLLFVERLWRTWKNLKIFLRYPEIAYQIYQAFIRVASVEFAPALMPMMMGTITDYYPDANPETYTFDGAMFSSWSSWATVRAAATSDVNYTKDDQASGYGGGIVGNRFDGGSSYMIIRAILLFRYTIPSGTTGISGKISQYFTSVSNNDPDAYAYVGVVTSAPASNTAIATGDYDSLGTVLQANAIANADIVTSSYNDMPLNSTGLASLTVDGAYHILKLGYKEGHDINNNAPGATNEMNGYFADNGSNKPYLEIAYGSNYTQTLTESVTRTDSLVKAIGKTFSLTVDRSDVLLKDTSRVLTESVTRTLVFVKGAEKVFTEVVSHTEVFLKDAEKVLSEVVTRTDGLNKAIGKIFTETRTVTEIFSRIFDRITSGLPQYRANDQNRFPSGSIKGNDKPKSGSSHASSKPTAV